MPGHLEAHWSAGGHIWGLFWLRPGMTVGRWAKPDGKQFAGYWQWD